MPRVARYEVGGVVLLHAGLLFVRLGSALWTCAALGFLVIAYYFCAVLRLAIDDAGTFLNLPVVALVLWLAAVITVVLPPVATGMRGYRR